MQKQVSLEGRLRKEQFQASKDAQAQGLNSSEHNAFVDNHLKEYKEVELIRRAVSDVKKRAEEMELLRKMKGQAYVGVKSKVGRNMKVINRVNKKRVTITNGQLSPE